MNPKNTKKPLLHEKEKAESKGQLPGFVPLEERCFFDLEPAFFPIVVYETRWVPNTNVVRLIADRYGLDFVHGYSEPMNGLSGEARYLAGNLTESAN